MATRYDDDIDDVVDVCDTCGFQIRDLVDEFRYVHGNDQSTQEHVNPECGPADGGTMEDGYEYGERRHYGS